MGRNDEFMEVYMIFKNKKLIFYALVAMMPFCMQAGPVDTCVAAGQTIATVGQAAATIDQACDLSGCTTVEPIASVAAVYNLGMATYMLGSMYYNFAAFPYRLCCGFPQNNQKITPPSLCDKASSALSGISILKTICKEGYEIIPDSVKWAVSSALPDSVKEKGQNVAKFIQNRTYSKFMALSAYVAYKVTQDDVTLIDTIGSAYTEIAMMKLFGQLGYSFLPNEMKVKCKNLKDFIDKYKVLKAAAFVGYVAYKASQQQSYHHAVPVNLPVNLSVDQVPSITPSIVPKDMKCRGSDYMAMAIAS